MCNIVTELVTEFYLYSIVYIYLINSRLDVTHSVCHHFRTIQTLSDNTFIQNGGSAVQGEGCTEVTSSIGIDYWLYTMECPLHYISPLKNIIA